MSSYTRQQLESWLKTIEVVSGKVLDVGGSQNPVTKRLMNTAIQWDEYKILDLEVPHQCKQKPDIVCDLNEMIGVTFPDKDVDYFETFDTVFCLEVSEYWWNPFIAISNLALLLKKGGILYISFHFIYPVHNPVENDYLRYTDKGVLKLLEETGFQIVENVLRTADSDSLSKFYSKEKMRPVKYYNQKIVGNLIKAKKI